MALSKTDRRTRIRRRIRKKLDGTATRPRLAVFRSNTQVYVQLIDDKARKTLAAASSREKSIAGGEKTKKTEQAAKVGNLIAEKCKELGIEDVVFERGGYKYHGRVKSLAEAARKGGLKF